MIKFDNDKQYAQKLADAMKSGDEKEIQAAWEALHDSIAAKVLEDAAELRESADAAILAQRGYRQITDAEKKWYQKAITALKSENPKQAFTTLIGSENEEDLMPTTIIEDVYKNLREKHPILGAINFHYAGYLTKWILNDHTVQKVHVYINSYGGEVAEGLAIYNALKRHKAKVVTYCDGFAASIASVIFMAGDKRVMSEASLLMVHNAWTCGIGNAAELRKQADDLDKITRASIEAYKAHSNLSEDEIKALLDAETWILPEEALEYGFATKVEKTENKHASQSVRQNLVALIKGKAKAAEEDDEEEVDPEAEPEEKPEAEPEEEDPEEEEPDEDEEKPEGDPEEKDNNATQMWEGLFNAIKNI